MLSQPKFAGFWRPESNGNFTMVPNQFFDEVVPNEPASVTKLVGLVIRRTLGWIGADGKRCQQAQISYSEFRRGMNMSNDTVAAALQIALNKGYIVKVREGRMNGNGGVSTGAFYSLAWYQTEIQQATTETHAQTSQPDITNQALATPTAKTSVQNAHSNNRTRQEAVLVPPTSTQSENQTIARSNNRTVKADLAQSDFRRDINKESLELINKIEIKNAHTPDSTLDQTYERSKVKQLSKQGEIVITKLPLAVSAKFVVTKLELDKALTKIELTETVTTQGSCSEPPIYMYQRSGSTYIQNLVRDLSRDFNDESHLSSNVSQALNLWSNCGCDERDFTMYLYEARKRTRANLGPTQTKHPNRMPYFFSVLRDLLKPSVTNQAQANVAI